MATVTVTSGLSQPFASGDIVTPASLNLLGAPNVSVSIDNNEITTAKILDLNVTPDKLAAGAVTGAAGGGKLAASAITDQTQKTSIAAADQFLIHSDSDAALRRVAWSLLQPSGAIIKTATSTDALSGWQNLGAFSVAGSPKTIPFDSTVPQSDEGLEIATVTITPTYNNSTIRIFASISSIASSAAVVTIASLFKGSDVNALRTAWRYVAAAASYHGEMSFMAEDSPATTSAVTYRLRLGPDSAATLYLGGQNTSGTSLGNTGKVVLVAQEIKA